MTDDREIIEQIDQLVDEEHALETRHAGDAAPLSDEEKQRLRALEVHLDQLWDLLRQRRGSAGRRTRSRRGDGTRPVDRRGLPPVAGQGCEGDAGAPSISKNSWSGKHHHHSSPGS